MSYPMSKTESIRHNVLSHVSIAAAELLYDMGVQKFETRYNQEYFIDLDPDKQIVLTIQILVVPKGEEDTLPTSVDEQNDG